MKKTLIIIIVYLTLAFILANLVSCKKDTPCIGAGKITITSRSIVGWSNPVNVIIEIKGLDNPYHGFIEPLSTKEHRIEGHSMIRVRTACSEWTDWIEIGY